MEVPRGRGSWVAIGAVVGALAFLVWAYAGSGQDRYEWLDTAVVMVPFGLLLGALVGAVIGCLRRQGDKSTRPDVLRRPASGA